MDFRFPGRLSNRVSLPLDDLDQRLRTVSRLDVSVHNLGVPDDIGWTVDHGRADISQIVEYLPQEWFWKILPRHRQHAEL